MLYDSADLLLRWKRTIARPAVDEAPPPDASVDDTGYALLTDAQTHYYGEFAAHFPWVLYGAPTKMETADNGLTYTFASAVHPLHVEIYDALNGRLLHPGAFWDESKDYVWEGSRIRFPKGRTRTFGDGPYARYITPPGVIDAATEPTLVPANTRPLLVYHAAKLWAERGGMRDPAPFERLERRAWAGDAETGEAGVLLTLKTQNPWAGLAAFQGQHLTGFAHLAQVEGYTPR